MATSTIRGVELHARLRVQAARHGRSMAGEVRSLRPMNPSRPGELYPLEVRRAQWGRPGVSCQERSSACRGIRMIILDTDVLSELTEPEPDSRVIDWLDSVPAREISTASVVAAELW